LFGYNKNALRTASIFAARRGQRYGMPVAKQPVTTIASEKNTRLEIPFAKMQGLGNDFVFIDAADLEKSASGRDLLSQWATKKAGLARALCDRRFGIGADGLILVRKTKDARCLLGWSYTNSDGSPSAMCGNGIRCLALWAHRRGLIDKGELFVDTEIGAIPVDFQSAELITTDLGEPVLDSEHIPMSGQAREKVLRAPLTLNERTVRVTCVNMGNPHCVLFEHGLSEESLAAIASQVQLHPSFLEGVNVEFVRVESPTRAHVDVFERGAGRTLACATGAAAVLVAGVLEESLQRKAQIVLPGGPLHIEWSAHDGHVRISGPAKFVFDGNVDLSPLLSKLSL
jgi:diaminopimelate epimerase